MDTEGPSSSVAQQVADRRKSGRSIRKPDLFAEEHHDGSLISNGSSKRKRTGNHDDADEVADDSTTNPSSSEDSEGDPDEEELKEKRRVSRNKASSGRHATKKAKTNGASTTLAIRSANIPTKSGSRNTKTQKARARPSQIHKEGLYAEVFGRAKSGEGVAADWLESLEHNNVDAIRDLVNFILQCIGCDLEVESYDIEDLDNVPSKLGDLLDEFQQTQTADYPLVSKLKSHVGFRNVITEFFNAIIKSLHASSVLYNDEAVFDNIQTWIATMSGAPLRPFRHTATVISLIISTALCEIAGDLQKSMATTRTQIESERKKKTVNKGRVKAMEQSMGADEKKLEIVDALLKDAFDTVFVHRYRDVEEKIRVECANALGTWIVLYRKLFLEGQYLRYLGWVLSDTNFHTRMEVIKQLKLLFKDRKNIAALRAFTDRFRPRIVEMGARDTDTGVRAEAIDLLDKLRNAELLEPNDIDVIGKLIFDAEPRVRKSVARFFVSNVDDLFKDCIEDVDAEQFEEALPKSNENDDYLKPTQSWIKFKCLAQTLRGSDSNEESDEQLERSKEVLVGEEMDSRYMLATQSIFPHMRELQEWESLAGYVLYDHSSIDAEATDTDVELVLQRFYKLDSSEERVLLDVLFSAVKLSLQEIVETQSDKKAKKTQASKDAFQEKQESAAYNLTRIIPQLLNKFGSMPQAAASILRLEQLLNIDLVNDLQQGDATYSSLLDDINKQFVSHSDRKVLAEASKALRQARTYEQSREAADAKLQELWEDASGTLQNLLKKQNIETRGTLPVNVLTEVSNTVSRISNLAGISDCSSTLESKMVPQTAKKQKVTTQASTLLDLLLLLLKRGQPDEATTARFAEIEDELCLSIISTLSLYFRWKVFGLKTAITSNNVKGLTTGSLVNLTMYKVSFVEALTLVILPRPSLDHVRISGMLAVLDIFTLFSTVRHMKPSKGPGLPDELAANLRSLSTAVPADLQEAVMQTHERLEKSFAKKTRRKLEKTSAPEPGEDDAPIDSDDENDEVEEDEDEEDALEGKDARKQAALLAEQALCEVTSKIVLGVIGGIMDVKLKERLTLNRSRLGKSYTQVLGYLEEKKSGKKEVKKGVQEIAEKEKLKAKSTPIVLEDDDIEDDEMEAEEGIEDDDNDEEAANEGIEPEAQEAGEEPDDIMGD